MTLVNIELVVGRTVRTQEGKRVGRIEAVCAHREGNGKGDDWVVDEFHVGPHALIERLSLSMIAALLPPALRPKRDPKPYRIPWQQLDLSDPWYPRLIAGAEVRR
ncbi:hypothetical protein [Paraburkholderia kururiensis]|uniref:PRC-barrel domain-containing protein n=1 Tax=Paraburkholderia kururiensis TaxID=984307 RepID=A0ABZ0WMV7_9BURK|nr:hypothetical protein [Paraburkholderia kururiensis]WQD78707.1 hypothetical protein U0042_03075 [Paraburkholderia kururiensis]